MGLANQPEHIAFYGSKAKPKEIFGEDTPELNAFYIAANKVAPGAWELLQDLLASWQPNALKHSWKLPDGYDAVVKVMQKREVRIEVDELDHATFSYEFYENEGQKSGLSNVANVVHSVDAYVLRCIHRRCNYNHEQVSYVLQLLDSEWNLRHQNMGHQSIKPAEGKLAYYIEQYTRTGMADAVIFNHIRSGYDMLHLDIDHINALICIAQTMLVHRPFEVVTVHDEFKTHCNNMNHLRQHYINIFAELAESNVLSDLLSQIHGKPGKFTKLSSNLGELIRGSNYGLS